MALRFAKLDADLDSNPKVRLAGRSAREVFTFILRQNAKLDRTGRLPLAYIDPDYLAYELMMTTEEARDGVSRAVTAGLLRTDSAHVVIAGWSDDWAKAPLTDAQRQALKRERDAATAEKPKRKPRASRTVTEPKVTVTESHACHASEEIREEEKRGEEKTIASPPAPREPSGPHQAAVAEFDAYYRRTHSGAAPTWNGKTGKLMAGLIGKHGLPELVKRIASLEQRPPPWPPSPWDFGTFVQHFDKLAAVSQGALPVTGRYEPVLGQRVGGEVEL